MTTPFRSIRTAALIASALALVSTGHAAITSNAITSNAITSNALTPNALTNNAITSNALTNNALTNNGLPAQAPASAQPARQAAPVGAYMPSASWTLRAIRVEATPISAR